MTKSSAYYFNLHLKWTNTSVKGAKVSDREPKGMGVVKKIRWEKGIELFRPNLSKQHKIQK